MAIRRKTQKAQVIAQLQQVAPPGEQFLACVHCESGPSPWLSLLYDEVPFLGTIVYWMRNFYFITVTSSHVVMNSANRVTNRPGGNRRVGVTACKVAACCSRGWERTRCPCNLAVRDIRNFGVADRSGSNGGIGVGSGEVAARGPGWRE